jgi:hypothetical protein
MPIHSDKNLYAGVNPHLNSYLQVVPGYWESFHSTHITYLQETLLQELPDGYESLAEKSLQISAITPPISRTSGSKADVLIFGEPSGSTATAPSTPVATLSLADVGEEIEYLTSIVIYRVDPKNLPGIPVTRIELLSPSNKAGGSHHAQYLQKRLETLYSGLNLVEIDYLHHQPPTVSQLPSYADSDKGAYPFLVLVSNPHPAFAEGHIEVYGSVVDQPLPQIALPLAGEDSITLDLNIAYNRASMGSAHFFRRAIDYEQLPLAFERYSTDDQERIRARMAVIANAS